MARLARLVIRGMPQHVTQQGDREQQTCLVKVAPLLGMIDNWRVLLAGKEQEREWDELRGHSRTGRPLGDEAFMERLEGLVSRALNPEKGGRRKKQHCQ